MTSITVAGDAPDLGVTIEAGAVARLRRVAGPGGVPAEQRWSWSGSVPVGLGQGRRVPLREAGIYEIEFVLPSGQILSEQHEVAEGQNLRLTYAVEGPFVGARTVIGSRATPTLVDEQIGGAGIDFLVGGSAISRRRGRPSTKVLSAADITNVRPSAGQAAGLVAPRPWNGILVNRGSRHPGWSSWDIFSERSARPTGDAVIAALLQQASTVSWVSAADSVVEGRPFCWRLPTSTRSERRYALAAISVPAGGVEIAVLPLPPVARTAWSATDVELSVSSRSGARAFHTRVSVRDKLAGGLLAYLAGGNMNGARTILGDLENGLTGRGLDDHPLVASAAGYVTLATERRRSEAGGERLRALMERHPWLPDGAILFARWRLRFARGPADVATARAALRQAYARGLPYFSAGIENLDDALSLAAPGDDQLEAMGRAVSAARACTDTQQAFTVLRVG